MIAESPLNIALSVINIKSVSQKKPNKNTKAE